MSRKLGGKSVGGDEPSQPARVWTLFWRQTDCFHMGRLQNDLSSQGKAHWEGEKAEADQ